MMTDFSKIKDILEMAELLEEEFGNTLVVKTVNATDDATVSVVFVFDDEQQLVGMYTEC
jgi:hypothetical protein